MAILAQLEADRQTPTNAGAFSLQGQEDMFQSSMRGLEEVLEELAEHMDEYEGSDDMGLAAKTRNVSTWAATGQTDALEMLGFWGMIKAHCTSFCSWIKRKCSPRYELSVGPHTTH